jgi:predicted phosphoribosyltransferase
MQPVIKTLLQNREEAGYLLSKRLAFFKNSNAVVIGIPHGGVCVASVIAKQLSLPLEVMPCRKIKHPGNTSKHIGSVCEDEVYIHDCSRTIPQDYIHHQIVLARNAIAREAEIYSGSRQRVDLRYRPVILVDDILKVSDTMMACLRSMRKQNPLKIVVAVAVASAEAARIVSAQADEVQYLRMDTSPAPAREYFVDFPRVDERRVKELLESSRNTIGMYE